MNIDPIQPLVTCIEGHGKMDFGCEDFYLRPLLMLLVSARRNFFPCALTHMVNSG